MPDDLPTPANATNGGAMSESRTCIHGRVLRHIEEDWLHADDYSCCERPHAPDDPRASPADEALVCAYAEVVSDVAQHDFDDPAPHDQILALGRAREALIARFVALRSQLSALQQELATARQELATARGDGERLEEAMRELAAMRCSDGYCDLAGRATGQHTNGGCQCLREIRNPRLRAWLRNALSAARALRSQLSALQQELATAREDSARLDWMSADLGLTVEPCPFGDGWRWGVDNHVYRELRDAIDHARNPASRYETIEDEIARSSVPTDEGTH